MASVKALRASIGKLLVHLSRASVRLSLLGIGFAVASTAILSIGLIPRGYDLSEGDVAQTDIRAPRAVVNPALTEARQAEAERAAVERARADLDYWLIDEYAVRDAVADVGALFDLVSEERIRMFYSLPSATSIRESSEAEPLSVYDFRTLERYGVTDIVRRESPPTQAELAEVAADVARETREERGLDVSVGSVIALLNTDLAIQGSVRAVVEESLALVMGESKTPNSRLPATRNEVERYIRGDPVLDGVPEALVNAAVEMGRIAVRENIVLDSQKIEAVKASARREVEPVIIKEGEVIVRDGEQVSSRDLRVLQELGMLGRTTSWLSLLGLAIFSILCVVFVGLYVLKHNGPAHRRETSLALFGLVLLTGLALIQVVKLLFFSPATGGSGFLVPVAFAAMLVSVLIDSKMGVVCAVILGAATGLVFEGSFRFALVALVGGIAGAFSISRHSDRSGLMRSGFIVAGIQITAVTGVYMVFSDFRLVYGLVQTGLVGVISAILAIGTLPFLENLFGVTSSIRFLELANPSQPLLKRLMMTGSGTYHHSIIMGNLAEAAVSDIGGDALLVRVGALYHDIGKLKRPYFFIENQISQENPHDKLSPSLSTLIIVSHVKDGVEVARSGKLPREVIDLIEQHHGTSLVSFFYRRAQDSAEEGAEIPEKDFRYDGPKPQSKEAAVVMLADSVEAAVRSLKSPSPDRIENLVHRIIREKLNDGQLDESPITLRDLDAIADAFVRVLTGMFHARVEYPEAVIKEMQRRYESNGKSGLPQET